MRRCRDTETMSCCQSEWRRRHRWRPRGQSGLAATQRLNLPCGQSHCAVAPQTALSKASARLQLSGATTTIRRSIASRLFTRPWQVEVAATARTWMVKNITNQYTLRQGRRLPNNAPPRQTARSGRCTSAHFKRSNFTAFLRAVPVASVCTTSRASFVIDLGGTWEDCSRIGRHRRSVPREGQETWRHAKHSGAMHVRRVTFT